MRPTTVLLTGFLMLTGLPAAAQQSFGGPGQDPEVMNYRLSMEKLRKLVQMQRAFNAASAKDPQLFDKINQESQASEKKNGGPLTVAQKVAILERYPGAQRAFTSVGGSARDWLLSLEAMGNAYVTIAAREGTVTGPPPATDAQRANVALLDANQAEFEKILEELDQLTDQLAQ
jgi:hypothetical protein